MPENQNVTYCIIKAVPDLKTGLLINVTAFAIVDTNNTPVPQQTEHIYSRPALLQLLAEKNRVLIEIRKNNGRIIFPQELEVRIQVINNKQYVKAIVCQDDKKETDDLGESLWGKYY